jgi:hypothetical protein
MRRPPFPAYHLVLALSVAFAACGDDDVPSADGGVDARVLPDGEVPDAGVEDLGMLRSCRVASDCTDRVDCTVDTCDPRGFCRNTVDLNLCDDAVFCNGVEQCDLIRGCVPGPPETCNDDDVCTIDRCDETTKSCGHSPRDFDEDGEADWHCADGTDCNDGDPAIGSLASELCGDGIDNDCDGTIDEADCGGPPYDTACDAPLDVSAGGLFTVSTVGAVADYVLPCGGTGYRDLILTFTTTEPKDLSITADGVDSLSAIELRNSSSGTLPDCPGGGFQLPIGTGRVCNSGYPAQIRTRALPAGTYFLVVASAPWTTSGGDTIDLEVTFSAATAPPTNEACAAPMDVSAGGRFAGSFVDVLDDVTLPCGYSGSPDLVYSFDLAAPKNVHVTATSATGETISGAIYSTCGLATASLRCTGGAPFDTTVNALPAGSYYLVLDGPSYRAIDFTLDVTFSDPTPVAPGDTCATAIPLVLDTLTPGTLADKQDDLVTSCGYNYAEAVYSFVLTEARDVTVLVDGGTRYMNASVRPTCDDGATQLQCTSGLPVRSRLRNLAAGTYFVVVEGYSRSSFELTVTASVPVPVVEVTGNDVCGTAVVVPATGGLFTGTTVGSIDDYHSTVCTTTADGPDVAFQLDLTASKVVTASTAGSSFDTVLMIFGGSCTTLGDLYCNDDGGGGTTSLLTQTLAAGTYFFVVDGYSTGSSGTYTFEITLADP